MTVDLSTFLVLGIVFLAIAYRHRASNNETEKFHIANWSAGSFAIVASVIALFGAGEISTFTELYSFVGSGIIVFFFGASMGFICIYFISDKVFNETKNLHGNILKKAYHINDVVYDRYGKWTLIIFTLLASVSLLALFLIQVIVGSDLIALGTGINYSIAVIGVSLFIALYVIISGLEGIYSTDKIQLVALFAALTLISYNAVNDFNVSISGEFLNTFRKLDFSTSLTLFFPGFFAVVGADVLQRFISAKSTPDLKKISIASSIGWLILGSILVVFSAGIANYSTAESTGFLEFLSNSEGTNRVIIIVALVCALLSTADTEAHSIALLINRGLSPKSTPSVIMTRVLIGIVCIIGCFVALIFKDLTALYTVMLNIFLILGPIAFAIFFKRGSKLSVNATMIISSLVLVFYTISDFAYGTSHLLGLEILVLFLITSLNLFIKNKNKSHAE